ncbi:1,2-phenylacetyl-CoA epoxidase subunit PaaC [Paracoccus benzoatiresistens]|uniref:Phenylacetate-CoA oxygenase subunit PaaC n=1 Tax=Paracoccus benzoatiresistens TaxID=2997341 RepID=A0ABT4J0S7_9RHOB|nr:1,2-phenylacetyl-CoA epoxidase subunit PaaC [Paracoccus sp. EF6]MCZ0960715.1 phenylacetate-CoA oxygenase subunit PaaC [Paracoccus sp. EF6]
MPSLPDMTTPNLSELAGKALAESGHVTVPAPDAGQEQFSEWLQRMGDNALILGHRASEWCGHAPALEEDIALANQALDLIGQCQLWLGLAAEVEAKGGDADRLAYLRDAGAFRNLLLVELPNGDFGMTLMRQFLFDAFHHTLLLALKTSSDSRVADIAAKAEKEVAYHLERSADLVIRLGDGTAESHNRMQAALTKLWSYTGEMFADDAVDQAMADAGIAPLPSTLKAAWEKTVTAVLDEATLVPPASAWQHGITGSGGGKKGVHTEHLGYILAEMQFLQRAYPGARW